MTENGIQYFMTMYLKNPRGVHTNSELTALWDSSFKSPDETCLSLLGVMSYLMPDVIPQELFEADRGPLGELDFCCDEWGLSHILCQPKLVH